MLKEKLGFNASIRLLLPVLLILLLFSSGCSRIQPEATAEQFYALWGEQDYKAMYELLDSASRKAYSAESFVERYTSISPVSYTHLDVYKRQAVKLERVSTDIVAPRIATAFW